jgi:putative SOS response-associated peptidase YedK
VLDRVSPGKKSIMCGRFVAATDPDHLADLFDVDDRRTDELPASWNVAPTMPVYAIAEHREARYLVSFRWGLVPTWVDDPKVGSRMINARMESVAEKPAYRTALQRRRCIIPADGFYEWHTDATGRTAYYIHRADGHPLAFAGLWEGWKDPAGTWLRTCTIITGAADERLAELHPRMPIVLPSDVWAPWLDRDERRPGAALGMLSRPDTWPLVWHPVSTQVNNVRNDHPQLIAAVDHSETST